MKIGYRVDSGHSIGTGHLLRCLRLARFNTQGENIFYVSPSESLDEKLIFSYGYKLVYVVDELTSICDLGRDRSYVVFSKRFVDRERLDLLVVDSYRSYAGYERSLACKQLMVIDDLALNTHYCDFLLDYSYGRNKLERYKVRVNNQCQVLLGQQFSIVDYDLYCEARKGARVEVDIVVFFGGVDLSDHTGRILDAITECELFDDQVIVVVVGVENRRMDHYRLKFRRSKNIEFVSSGRYFYSLLNSTRYLICSGGSVSFDKILFRVQSLAFTVAQNQLEQVTEIERLGLHINGGDIRVLSDKDLKVTLSSFLSDAPHFLLQSNLARNSVNPLGGRMVLERIFRRG